MLPGLLLKWLLPDLLAVAVPLAELPADRVFDVFLQPRESGVFDFGEMKNVLS